jgi:hypothetical protein
MNRSIKTLLGAMAILAAATPVFAQITALNPFKINQPWIKPLASHASIVDNCSGQQVTFAPIAMDDFLCTKNGPLVRIEWWGTMDGTFLPPQRNFFVRIYGHTGSTCQPTNPLYSACVQASSKLVGIDCQQKPVYHFRASLPSPHFVQTAGTRYWLQISEVDRGPAGAPAASPRPGVVDWRWSAHRDIKNCPAIRRGAAGATSTLIDPCDDRQDDLAFRIYSRTIIGTVPANPRSAYTASFYLPGTSTLADTFTVSPDDDGTVELFTELPDGVYDIRLSGMSGPGLLLPAVQLADGSVLDLGELDPGQGDANSDGMVNFTDITTVLANFGRMAP